MLRTRLISIVVISVQHRDSCLQCYRRSKRTELEPKRSKMVIDLKTKVGTCTIIQSNSSEAVVVVGIIVSLHARGVASGPVLAVLLTMYGFNVFAQKSRKSCSKWLDRHPKWLSPNSIS